jgi:thiol-disulfide isomerase/thioredoxin
VIFLAKAEKWVRHTQSLGKDCPARNMRTFFSTLLGAALAGAVSTADAANIGSKAPKLQIEHWVKGKPVDLAKADEKKIHILEFWATWCGPCRDSIPHLTKLQEKYKGKGVTVVGITDEPKATVERFVRRQGKQMEYTVAIEKGDTMSQAYMRAFGQTGIPATFVVDQKDRIVWVGHPKSGLDDVIDRLVKGTFNLEEEIAKERAQIRLQQLSAEYWERLVEGKKDDDTRKIGKELLSLVKANAEVSSNIAWAVLTDDALKYRDLEFARAAAKAAFDLTKGSHPQIIDTYALALFESGKVNEAITLQKKAVSLARDQQEKVQLQKSLDRFQATEKK